MKIEKRGQITLIIIIVVGLFILFFLLSALVKKNIPEPKPSTVTDNAKPVKTFVENCLYHATADGLELLGKQGGVIYHEQGGLTPDLFENDDYSVFYNDYHLFYSISPGGIAYQRSCDPRDIGKPIYLFESCPSITYPFVGLSKSIVISYKATDSEVPPQDNIRIMNTFSLPGLYPNQGVYIDKDMKETQILTNPRNKIYNSLSAYIKHDMKICLNYSKLKKRDYSVKSKGDMQIEPVFSDDFTQVNLEMPLVVLNLANDQTINLNKFTAKVPIRFGKIYKYVRNILFNEAKDFTFNLSEIQKRDYDGIKMELKKDVIDRIDIFNFTDENSIYSSEDGLKRYSFYGAIPNSAPAISYFYTNISNKFIPGLKSYLISCPQFSNHPEHNPFEPFEDTLMIKLGRRMDRDTVKCLFWAYNKTFYNSKWKPAYDADDDELMWNFKTKNSSWGESFLFSGGKIIFDNYVLLNFSDGDYYDIEKIPITLKNHKPIIKNLTYSSSVGSSIIYDLIVEDIDAVLGPDVDYLSLSYFGDIGIFEGSPPSYVGAKIQGNLFLWPITFKNQSGNYHITFNVTDEYGLSDSKSFTVNI